MKQGSSETPEEQGAEWTLVAHLLRPQGRKGELLAELLTDFPERFSAGARVYLVPPPKPPFKPGASTPPAKAASEYLLEGHWLPQGKNSGRVVLKFTGVDSINDAELLKAHDVVVPREERLALADGAAYISDLVGCALFNGAARVGLVEDVEFPAEEGAGIPDMAPLLVVVDDAGEEILVPFAKAWLRKLDVGARRIEMDLPEGLLEINASGKADRSGEAPQG